MPRVIGIRCGVNVTFGFDGSGASARGHIFAISCTISGRWRCPFSAVRRHALAASPRWRFSARPRPAPETPDFESMMISGAMIPALSAGASARSALSG